MLLILQEGIQGIQGIPNYLSVTPFFNYKNFLKPCSPLATISRPKYEFYSLSHVSHNLSFDSLVLTETKFSSS